MTALVYFFFWIRTLFLKQQRIIVYFFIITKFLLLQKLKLINQVKLERVVKNLIRQRVEIDEMQCGFMSGRGTTDAIFIVRQLQEKHLYNSLSYMCAKFQLHSPKGFWEENFGTVFFFSNYLL